uniref:uncharacterized protein LOC120334021 n=1 Tax=Styela clava TaxID=7725 RepID=UPI00193A7AD4|nr:uncharacterized protein LOC120334021 [Styela clava]
MMKPEGKGRKKSFVWDHFRVSEIDPRKAICNSCGAEMVRGRDARSFGTSSLANHIKYCKKIPQTEITAPQKRKSGPNICVLLDNSTGSQDDERSLVKIRRTMSKYEEPQPSQDLSDIITLPKISEIYISPDANDERYQVATDSVCSKRMDLVHSGMLMHVLYQQHRSGKLCDLTLISSSQVTATSDSTKKRRQKTFKAHSFVLAGLSEKIKDLVEMGSRTIELKDVTAFGLETLLQIVYTGKLRKSTPLTFYEAHQIWKSASDLGIKYVHEYLATEHPQVTKWIIEDSMVPEPMKAFTMQDLTETHETEDLVDLHAGHQEHEYIEMVEGEAPVKTFEDFIEEHNQQQQQFETEQIKQQQQQIEVQEQHQEEELQISEPIEETKTEDPLVEITFEKS